jgi:16S rRNA (guanine966-N2)-methyltransferase
MRIIAGKFKGFIFKTYRGDNTRPTTDLAKEGLFNTLDSIVDFTDLDVLDLFAGTGNIGLEFLSRGAAKVESVDHQASNTRYMEDIRKSLDLEQWKIHKSDVLKFVREKKTPTDLVFADPPYDYSQIHDLVSAILELEWFRSSGAILVLEHVDRLVFKQKEVFLKKQYGNTAFTCFKSAEVNE